ncbi:MAG: hypothetical protein U0232_23105 [Thermomicrobiales bacterium]
MRGWRLLVLLALIACGAVRAMPPVSNWRCGAIAAHPRSGHTATLLADGRVLVAGGYVCLRRCANHPCQQRDHRSGTQQRWRGGGNGRTRTYHRALLLSPANGCWYSAAGASAGDPGLDSSNF